MAEDSNDKPLTLKGLVEYIGPIFQELKLGNLETRREMKAGFEGVTARFGKVDAKFEGVNERLGIIKNDIHMLDKKIDSKVDAFEIKLNNKFEKQAILIDDLKKDLKSVTKTVSDVPKHEKRITSLEQDVNRLKPASKN